VATILLVAENPVEADGLRRELQPMGHDVVVAPGSFYALTLLERNRPDVLIAWPDVGEPSAEELCSILRQDPAMQHVRLVLVRPDGSSSESPPGVVVVRPAVPGELVTAIARHVHALAGDRPAAPSDAGQTQPVRDAGGLVGRLDTIQLVNLVQALAQLRRTGCLRVMFVTAESRSYFLEGRLIHATFGDLSGEEAVRESLLEAEAQAAALFSFDRYDVARIGLVPVTIQSRLESVLLDASAQLDRRRHGPEPEPEQE
jgi:CheY-like chemotaxis protein